MRVPSRILAVLSVLALAASASAAPPTRGRGASPDSAADARAALAAKIPGVKPEELRPSPIPGLWELSRGAEVTYVSADGQFLLMGDIYRIPRDGGPFPNLSDARRRELRAELLAAIPDSETIPFGPAKARHTITVFTDPDCSWCRKMHSQIAEYNRLGIRIRYAFFPREGPDSEAWRKSEAVWCSRDRQDALTRAKQGQPVKVQACGQTPVRHTWELGRELGVEGTPGLVLGNGELIPGYLPPRDLLRHLDELAAADKTAAAKKG